jgi:hypothetical protein
MHGVILGFTITAGLFLYFAPTLIAIVRSHKRCAAVFLLNLLFGWTVIGWIATVISVVEQRSLDREPARSWPVETDTWSFDPKSVSDRKLEQNDRWVLA